MSLSIEQAAGQTLLWSFDGRRELPPALQAAIQGGQVGGVTLSRHQNVENPTQVYELTTRLQQTAAAAGQPPLLIGADQEGGQLNAIAGGTTLFPGNMALGATNSEALAYQVGKAVGDELAAMGVNVAYAPVCDVNSNPENPVIGTRAYGSFPDLVGRLASAQVQGLQAAGVAATAKHFPGHGDTATDSHYRMPVVTNDRKHLYAVDLPPFLYTILTGVQLVMAGHISAPALNDGQHLPASLSPELLQRVLRHDLGFQGVVISDAMNMRAIPQGKALPGSAVAAAAAGVDLLLLKHESREIQAVYAALVLAAADGRLPAGQLQASAQRILHLKDWLAGQERPPMSVVGCCEHQDLALEVARRSLTLAFTQPGLLPLQLAPRQCLMAITPRPEDLTPSDTSSTVQPELAQALRRFHTNVMEATIPLHPGENEIADLCELAERCALIVIGTINTRQFPAQAALVQALIRTGIPAIVVALRLPYGLNDFAQAAAGIATYSLMPVSMQALAEALFGKVEFAGKLPVSE